MHSKFGHILAPRPVVATSEVLRVLKPGGAIAFSTWNRHGAAGGRLGPEGTLGRVMAVLQRYRDDPATLQRFRAALEGALAAYHRDDATRMEYLVTRAIKP